jgi:uncharacterized protein
MPAPRLLLPAICVLVASLVSGCDALVRDSLFHPTHHSQTFGLTPWVVDGQRIGFARLVEEPENVWLLLQRNAGQAADRTYALPRFSSGDAVYILEYPGFGERDGEPSFKTINAAATAAYEALRRQYPGRRLGVAGESIGTGPACMLATRPTPPDKLVLAVPFDDLVALAREHMAFLPVGTLLGKTWNNGEALATYRGPVDIYAAIDDRVIPKHHAESLAKKLRHVNYTLLPGGHNDWSANTQVRIEFE